MNCTWRKYARRFLRPFNETYMIAVQTILNPGSHCFFFILQPVQVDMKYHSAGRGIFINNGKGRAAYNIRHALQLAKCMDKGRFSCTHIAMKSDHFFIVDCLPKPASCILYLAQLISYFHRAKIFVDLQQGLED